MDEASKNALVCLYLEFVGLRAQIEFGWNGAKPFAWRRPGFADQDSVGPDSPGKGLVVQEIRGEKNNFLKNFQIEPVGWFRL